MGYTYISLSDILREIDADAAGTPRTELQDVGNRIRNEHGYDYLAQKAIEIINASSDRKFVIDSIRNTHEIETLKRVYSGFFLFAIWASSEIRWNRVSSKYSGNQTLFEEDDKRDRDEKIENGQQITLCYQMADVVILNQDLIHNTAAESFTKLKLIVKKYVDLIEKTEDFVPTEQETLMTLAYANSLRSSCTQRKVGALIIDEFGNVFSSGYNEVPTSERPCKMVYGKCYRKHLRELIDTDLGQVVQDESLVKTVSGIVKKHSKMLDYCRALHAEESAIVNMARLSISAELSKATLYTTTYPCNLCANKIVHVGIKRIIYFEPYPQIEAKEILKAHRVEQIPFEGITFNGYFRFMEVLR